MISCEKAQRIILKHSHKNRVEIVPLMDSLGCILAEKIRVPVPLPHWDNSAMDGFVLKSEDTHRAHNQKPVFLKITGVLKAGDQAIKKLKSGEAVRIMTGAPIPRGADTVVPKEMAVVENQTLKISGPVVKGRHIRKRGEEIEKGAGLDLIKTPVHPGTIAFLSQIGKTKVRIYAKPKVSVLSTGSELIRPGTRLPPGKIYDSNSPMLAAALISHGLQPCIVQTLRDEPGALRRALVRAFGQSDIVLLSGGVSVGDYDFSKTVLQAMGVKTLFWKVGQKPGKPLYFGSLNSKLIFGLPGNPASAFLCFYEYVLPAIRCRMGFSSPFLQRQNAKVDWDIKRDPSKTIFLKGQIDGKGRVLVLRHQASHMISSLHETNGFLVVPPGNTNRKKKQPLFFDKLP